MAVKNTKRRALCLTIALSMIIAMFPQMAFANDYQSHWAGSTISTLVEKGIVVPDKNGNTSPERNITRAETAAIIVRAFGLTSTDENANAFSDVMSSDWFAKEINIAHKAGIISGDAGKTTVRPLDAITREELASMVGRYLAIPVSDADAEYARSQFSDASMIRQYAVGYVGALAKEKIINGYPDGTFKGAKNLKRAEAFVVLEKMMEGTTNVGSEVTVGTGKVLGDDSAVQTVGSVSATGPNTVIKNMIINDDLVIYGGGVTLEGVTVKGNVMIKGGKADALTVKSTALVDSALAMVNVQSDGAGLNVVNGVVNTVQYDNMGELKVNKEMSDVAYAAIESNVKLSDSQPTMFAKGEKGAKVLNVVIKTNGKVQIDGNVDKLSISMESANVVLVSGKFGSIEITQQYVSLKILGGSVVTLLTIDKGAGGAKIETATDASITKVVVNDKATFAGKGTIGTAEINSVGVIMETKPTTITGDEKPTIGVVTPSGGGGGGSGGSGGGSEDKIVDMIAVTTNPTQMMYSSGQAIDYTGLSVTVTYTDKTTEVVSFVNFSSKGLTIDPAQGAIASDPNVAAGTKQFQIPVTIKHVVSGKMNKQIMLNVIVNDVVNGVEINQPVTQTVGMAAVNEVKAIEITTGAAIAGSVKISYGDVSATVNVMETSSKNAIAMDLATALNAKFVAMAYTSSQAVSYTESGKDYIRVTAPMSSNNIMVDGGGTGVVTGTQTITTAGSAGVADVKTITVAKGATMSGNIEVTICGKAFTITVANGDTAAIVAQKIATAIGTTPSTSFPFNVTVAGDTLTFTQNANYTTLGPVSNFTLSYK